MWITTFFHKIERRNRNITKENYVIVYDAEEKTTLSVVFFLAIVSIYYIFIIYSF
jgi:hypothetical protein